MTNEPHYEITARESSQLTQVRVPLEHAAEAFSARDENGRIPIVVITQRGIRVSSQLLLFAVVVFVAGFLGDAIFRTPILTPLGIIAALAVLGLVAFNAVRIRIPEGINALLARAGKYVRTIGPGLNLVLPWIAVTHLVTRREIPFTVPIEDAPTQDNVRALVNTLITFNITEPHRFVFNISADDFDLVLYAACQNELRKMIRGITSEQINDLPRHDLTALRETLSERVAAYGIAISKVSITFAKPPDDFMVSQEARELAAFRQREQQELQALAVRRQTDTDVLALQIALAQQERERDILRAQIKKQETRKELVELEARVAERRLALLEERLKDFPNAAKWERVTEQLDVMRALAGNSRTILQLGNSDELLRAVFFQEAVLSGAAADGGNSMNAQDHIKPVEEISKS